MTANLIITAGKSFDRDFMKDGIKVPDKHTKMYSISLAIRQIQIKNCDKYYYKT